ncbi:MAG TPA: GNAT family N-acetyltransferase [Nocardioides sp.]|nr:GNAT family N-acetyltransferase [Nocardioides sp.]
MSDLPEQPILTDGVVTLRPFDERDIDAHVQGDDDEIRYWFDAPAASTHEGMAEVVERWRREREAGTRLTFAVLSEGTTVGVVEARPRGETASLSWTIYSGHRGHGYATRATRLLVQHAFDHLGVRRVQAEVDPRNKASQRVATRSGLHREGLQRLEPGMTDRPDAVGMVIYARLVSDPPISEPEGFRALLNSFLPRKRAISQVLIRDHEGRVLICHLTYKRDWDLPGGVVEVGESPQLAAGREVQEELALDIDAGRLLLTDWLPPWGGWDDAICLVFDGGVHDPGITDRIRKQPREIRDAEFATLEQVRERCADFTARRIASALANVASGSGPAYVESGGVA